MLKIVKNFFKKRWYLVIGIFIILLFIFINNRQIKQAKEKTQKTYQVKKETLKETLSLSGEIDAEEKAILRFQTSGRLAWVGVKEGDYVKKYQTIASLDKRDLQNRLDKYLNTYAKQRNSFEQTKDDTWNQQYAFSESLRNEAKRILENNQYDLNNAVLDVEYQNLFVEYASLWTPIEGVVTKVDSPFAGVNITPATAEFEIVNPKTLYFSATVEQVDIVNLKEGLTGMIIFDSFPEKQYQGKIYFISFSPKKEETGTVYQIKIKLSDEALSLPLRLSMTGDIEFLIKEKKEVLSVPSSFVKKDKSGYYLIVKKDGREVKQQVVLGEEIDGKYVIKDGIFEGDLIYD